MDYRGCINGEKQRYFFPVGWEGYALELSKKYDIKGKWFQANGDKETWVVLYHGTPGQLGVESIAK